MLLWRLTITGRRRGHFSDHAKPLQLCEKRCAPWDYDVPARGSKGVQNKRRNKRILCSFLLHRHEHPAILRVL